MRDKPQRPPLKAWLALASVLLLFLAGMALLIEQQWRQDNARSREAAQRELGLLASLLQTNLQQGNYQAAAQLLQDWGEKEADIVSLRLVSANAFPIGEYLRPAPAASSLALETPIQYSYRGEARLYLVKDLEHIDRHRDTLILQLGAAFLILAALLAALTRALLLYRREAAELRARGRELDRANAELSLAMSHRQAAEQERDRLISILEATTDLVSMADPEGNLLYLNRAGRRMLGLDERPVSAFRIPQFHPEWATERILNKGIPAAIRDGAWSGETALLGADGREIPVSQVILSHRDAQGRLQYLSTVMRDISERQEARRRLEARDALLRRLSERVPGVIYQLRMYPDGRACFPYASEGIRDIYAVAPEEVREDATPVFDRLHPDDLDAVARSIRKCFDELTPWRREYRVVLPQRGERWVRGEAVPERLEDGSVLWHGYIADVTEFKQAEEQIHRLNAELEQRVRARTAELADANRELEAFAYSVSHDLRAPLRAIDGFSLALLEDCAGQMDQTARGYLQRIRAASQRMAGLIDDLLKLSRVTRTPLKPERLDLSAMARDILAQLREADPDRQVETRLEEGLQGQGDAGLMRVVLENLLGNAWKYTARQPQARIEFGHAGGNGGTVFFVRDNGAGFDMRYADKLFGAFQRLHHPSEFEGSGIGLATVQRIIHRHGGRVWAEAEPGRGATFYFTLGRTGALQG